MPLKKCPICKKNYRGSFITHQWTHKTKTKAYRKKHGWLKRTRKKSTKKSNKKSSRICPLCKQPY